MGGSAAGVEAGLAALAQSGLARERRVLDSPQAARIEVDGRTLVNFASNDYLGLAAHPRLRAAAHAAIDRYGVGSGASPLVVGHQRPHQEAEERFAAFCRLPRALLFGSGYAANLGILATLADRHADVFCDRLNHACLNDGAMLSRGRMVRYAHGDLDALERGLAQSKASTRVVATDSVFSMDGDIADVPRIVALCERHDAWLVLDDAHGIGVLGERGRGVLDHFAARSDRIVYMATLGKALGSHGAFVAGRADVVEWVLQRARTYIFSTALPASAAAAASAALALLEEDASLVACLRDRIAHFSAKARALGVRVQPSKTAIQPIILGEAGITMEASRRLLDHGFLVPAIRPPTVPQGTSRLRVSLTAGHAVDDLDRLASALRDCLP
jgi:8-amino-7-oxononanoate synthase